MFNRAKPRFVSPGKITVFIVVTSVHCGSFTITVNVYFLVETSFILNSRVNDLFLFAVYYSTFCSAA